MNGCPSRGGHCWHLAGGEKFLRNTRNAPGLYDVHCCFCDATAKLEGFSKGVSVPPSSLVVDPAKHGPHLVVP